MQSHSLGFCRTRQSFSTRVKVSSARVEAASCQLPWQIAPQPVYAVGSYRPSDRVSNLSIATYVTAASISKGEGENKKYVVCLFKDSVTHGIVNETCRMSLSLLSEGSEAAALVDLLGKTHLTPENDKIARLKSDFGIECDTTLWDGLPLLPPSCVLGAMLLSVKEVMDAGDHDVFLCEVEETEQLVLASDNLDPAPLTTSWLKQHGVI